MKTIEKHIKDAFAQYGFKEEEIKNGCWLLEKKKNGILTPVAWIAYHKFLERVEQYNKLTATSS